MNIIQDISTTRLLRQTIIVNGRLAMRTERLAAARNSIPGVQVMAIEHLVERLAGGFLQMVDPVTLKKVIAKVLPHTDVGELEPIKDLPGMISAAAQTLMKFWLSDSDIATVSQHSRIKSILALEEAVVAELPPHMRRPGDLIRIALSRAHHAKKIFGKVIFRGHTDLHPVWRPVLTELSMYIDIVWDAGPRQLPDWYKSVPKVITVPQSNPDLVSESCATARHEVIEAFRWARGLMASGINPAHIAVATVATANYDDHFIAVGNDAPIGLHIVHGISAVHRKEGQTAAALADIVLRGLSQKRVRRLVDLIGVGNGVFEHLPHNWSDLLKEDATLSKLERWRKTLDRSPELVEVGKVLIPVLELLDKRAEGAAEAGDKILSGKTLAIWRRALLDGPAAALDRTIQTQRIDDGEDPLSSVCFMSAENLAASPRPYVRLIGLTSRSWPRRTSEDALIPDHVIPTAELDPLPLADIDRRDFETILKTTDGLVVLSWPRRDAEGRVLGVSSLVPQHLRDNPIALQRTRTPEHAMSEADRLFARPKEYALKPSAHSAQSAWDDWNKFEVTPHDGIIAPAHPRIETVFNLYHSATSIRMLLRDPLGFVWRYALGFSAPEYEDEPLTADPREFGIIVHDILGKTVEILGRKGGLAVHTPEAILRVIDEAAITVGARTETTKPIPPQLIWHGMMSKATAFAKAALLKDMPRLPGQLSFAEVPFGGDYEWVPEEVPWDPYKQVCIPGTELKLRGFIDRLDLSGDSSMGRVIDYKTGKKPKNLDTIVLNGGKEIQRPIYGYAVKTLLGASADVEAGLLYPSDDVYAPLEDISETLSKLAEFVVIAKAGIDHGNTVPGIDAKDAYNDLKFALPSNSVAGYLVRKQTAFAETLGAATEVWGHD